MQIYSKCQDLCSRFLLYFDIWDPSIVAISVGIHDDVIKWKHFPRNWPFVRGIHRSPVHSPHKVQWRGALMFSLICVWINDWVNNREAGDLRRYHTHYGVIVLYFAGIGAIRRLQWANIFITWFESQYHTTAPITRQGILMEDELDY